MRIMSCIIVYALSCYCGFSQSSLTGRVTFYGSGGISAKGVEVSASGANTVHTDNNGRFTLYFGHKKPGDPVDLSIGDKDAKGNSIVVVNDKQLEVLRIPSSYDNTVIEVLVCPPDQWEKSKRLRHDISEETELKEISDGIDNIGKKIEQDNSNSLKGSHTYSIERDSIKEIVSKYLGSLDKEITIQEADKAFNINNTEDELEKSISKVKAGIEVLNNRAEASKKIFDYEGANLIYDTIINYLEKIGVSQLRIVPYYTKKAVVLYHDTKYHSALYYQKKANEILEKDPEAIPTDLAIAYNHLGFIYRALNRYKIALKVHQKAVYIQKEISGSKHDDLAISYNHIALSYYAMDRYGKALKYHKKATKIRENATVEPFDLGISYMNTGITYAAMKNFRKAIEFLKKSLSIFKEVDPKHPDLAVAYNNIGLAYAKKKQFKEAQAAFKKYEKISPKEGITYRNWAAYHALQNNKIKALKSLEKAIKSGYSDLEWLKTDDSMDSLRSEKTFKKLLEIIEKRKEQEK